MGLIGSCLFIGVFFSAIIFQLSDYIGRKKFIQICWAISIIVVNLLFFTDINTRMFLCIVIGCLNAIYFCSYSYLLEITPKDKKLFMSHLFMFTEGFIPTFTCSLFFFMGGKHWEHLFFFTLMLAPLGLSLSIFLPKSPQFLMDKGKESQAKEVVIQIANFNGYSLPNRFKLKREEETEQRIPNEGKLAYFKKYDNFMKLAVFTIILSYWCFNGVLMDYYVKYVDANMFFINLLKSVAGIVAVLVSYCLLRLFNLKTAAIIVICFLLLWSVPLLNTINGGNSAMLLISLVGISGGINSLFTLMYFFVSDTFPPAIVPIVLSISHMCSNMIIIIAPEIAELQGKIPALVYIITTILALFTIMIYRKPSNDLSLKSSK